MTHADLEWLEQHEAQVWFRAGSKLGIELRRADGLRVQCSAWTWESLMTAARQLAAGGVTLREGGERG